MNLSEYPHRRYNPLTGDWVLVSPHRTKRPWQGHQEKAQVEEKPSYDPNCYLCPGNSRAGGITNPDYQNTFVFVNDFSALLEDAPTDRMDEDNLFIAHSERGVCKVICFSPRHDLTLPLMEVEDIRRVVDVWEEEYRRLGEKEFINYVQIFENRGATMGCSNPHPHGQIWSNETIPQIPQQETNMQRHYLETHQSCLLCDYAQKETERGERIVVENDSFVALVPFWAVWPFETMVLPRRHAASLSDLTQPERNDLASLMKRLGIRYDNLFQTHFPYSMGLHQRPTDAQEHSEWHFHIHYYPPLLRSATVKKFMVGYELLATVQRDISAESAAARLRELSETHFLRQE
ncbi:MAG: UDP-glucose--hexose-1-phosphate uridylyltransferase [Spirochaetaceae bacterium]|nr:UDP-glucose--hexose-1-phosphate uridylyltransferase [Spirochaetaceae bacterium]MCF7947075.1 UDP-glucose--hexose-1-phosphate uridylyltransferase [Spirochaetia bacterium]MCF7950076.1 UDP-glucose--hexose-1-phosphate uridylyltransferase [Spirochaetaceae bacterium]